ncbi:hypothetical protein [Agrobacterium rosae]|uniref:Uncharacterized protein n=1 Tax=Agrobacterium rosae TaxID=1972867 RepID=A0A1R3TG51_9HYPH|nr:hypothetical protein [Agrobacterium rosae]SCX02681.1 hypothetical protein DSM25559_0249 [Agrobacterium rosae]
MSDTNLKINGQPMLVHNWRQVLKRAWFVRFIVIAGLLSAFSTAAAFVARLMVQSKVREANDADQ